MSVDSAAKWLLGIGLGCLAFYWYPDGWVASGFIAGLYANLATSLISIAMTVLLIDRLYEQRQVMQRRAQLIRELGSSDRATAVRAAKEIKANGWLTDGSLCGADLSYADLGGAQLQDARFGKATLRFSNLSGTDLKGADFSEAVLDECVAERANLKGCRITGASLRRAGMSGAILDDSDMTGGIDLLRASFVKASLRSVRLQGARLEESDLLECDLTASDLSGANLMRANLSMAVLDEAVLERADLSDVIAWDEIASMRGARIDGIKNPPEGFRELAISKGAVSESKPSQRRPPTVDLPA